MDAAKSRKAQIEHLREEFRKHGIRKAKLGGFDVDGVLRGKYVSLDKFWGVAESGLGFCDVIFGWDSGDALYDNASVTGWHTGYPDAHATVDLSTYGRIPWEEATAAFLLDFEMPVSPRGVLQKVEQKARAMGFSVKCASEYEFFLFKETPESVRAKGYAGLNPLSPGMFGYSWLRASENAPLVHDLLEKLAAFDVEVEGFHTETGPGVYEAAIRYDGLMRAADKAALFKTAVKEICARHGVMPCSSSATRVEYRLAAADMNPYIAMAASVASGLYGIERELPLPTETEGNGYDAKGEPLPATLREATARLSESKEARDLLGSTFVDHYVRTREWECRQFEGAVTRWELERYFEII